MSERGKEGRRKDKSEGVREYDCVCVSVSNRYS